MAKAAERLDCNPALVYRLIESRALPALQLGGRGCSIRIDERELEAWLYEQGGRNGVRSCIATSAAVPDMAGTAHDSWRPRLPLSSRAARDLNEGAHGGNRVSPVKRAAAQSAAATRVERTGIEPVTSGLQSRRSPS